MIEQIVTPRKHCQLRRHVVIKGQVLIYLDSRLVDVKVFGADCEYSKCEQQRGIQSKIHKP